MDSDGTFSDGRIKGQIDTTELNEASGLAASRRHPGFLYVINDHGGLPRLYVISTSTAHVVAVLTVAAASNGDWEDLAVGPCPGGGSCIYIGDIGEAGHKPNNVIYRVREPDDVTKDQTVPLDSTLKYTWSEPNAETLMVDREGNVFLVSKVHNGNHPKLTKVPSSAWDQPIAVNLHSILTVPGLHSSKKDPVAGDISPLGTEVLIKIEKHLFYWNMADGNVERALQGKGTEVSYHPEVRGEAVAWAADGSGYYTLGEGLHEPLYFYARM
ncbi:uncharacterized protein LOC121373459 [Gigantopelta aegis]|uniref:uncharacterized protein LOC121373459 n=1 Tax=Gigantopelta aegis TaxID=1735272 RepID=UPI001B888E44|nr:uncharacterized protein LOC121373459 [Gigantopelta aegis]